MTDDTTWGPSDDAAAAMAGYGPMEPLFSATAFLAGLSSGEDVTAVVTPESLSSWGDFGPARDGLSQIGDWGVGSYPEPAPGATDVAYVKVLRGVAKTYQQDRDAMILVPAVVTLVWRPEVGLWLVHAFGQPVAPERVPRTSPGEAPEYTRAG